VHQRHEKELSLVLAKAAVPAACNCTLADVARQEVAGEGKGAGAMEVAGDLVEQQHGSSNSLRVAQEFG
jgi:hypothetical protein